ncbi:MAG: class I SAM-dependent methyltransferase [Hyphomicrobiales bacterium]|nr:class I SAM-dependent methyltransferase [Hyphomicrobiales bacterium]
MLNGTAAEAWNEIWSTEEGREGWLAPEPEVTDLATRLFEGGAYRQALDMGCGVGRHALELARIGYRTTATDLASAGLEHLGRAAEVAGLQIATREAASTELPFDDASFDYVVAYNVIHHGDEDAVQRSLAEVQRVLRIGGVFQATLLSRRSTAPSSGVEVSPNTYIWEDGEGDHRHPHYFCDGRTLNAFLRDYDWLYLEDRPVDDLPEYRHWHFAAERRQ